MKLLYITLLITGLCISSTYAQTNAAKTVNYSFDKASITVCNYDTKSVVFSRVFSDTTALQELNELSCPFKPVFLRAEIREGILIACELWNDHREYNAQENGRVLIPVKDMEGAESYALPPNYRLEIEGNTATFSFSSPYGNEMYDFTLEDRYVIVLSKDEFK